MTIETTATTSEPEQFTDHVAATAAPLAAPEPPGGRVRRALRVRTGVGRSVRASRYRTPRRGGGA